MRSIRLLAAGLFAAGTVVGLPAAPVSAQVEALVCPEELGGEQLSFARESRDETEARASPEFPSFRKLNCVYSNSSGPRSHTVDVTWWSTEHADFAFACSSGPIDSSSATDWVGSSTHSVTAHIHTTPELAAAARELAERLVRAAEPLAPRCGEPPGEGDDGAESRTFEPLLIGGGLGLVLVGAGPPVLGRIRGTGRHGPGGGGGRRGRLPAIDPWGDPVIVQDGSYQGGNPGDVWYGGEWISPEEAREQFRRDEEAIRIRDREQGRFWSDSQRLNEQAMAARIGELQADADADWARFHQAEADRAADLARAEQERRDFWQRYRDQGMREHAQWTARAEQMGRIERGAEWVKWGADQSIDVLSRVTGPGGKQIKTVYDHATRVGGAFGNYTATGDATAAVGGLAEQYATGHAADVFTGGVTHPALRPITRRLPLHRVLGQPGTPPTIRSAVRDVVLDRVKDAMTKDPVKNVIQGAVDGEVTSLLRQGLGSQKP